MEEPEPSVPMLDLSRVGRREGVVRGTCGWRALSLVHGIVHCGPSVEQRDGVVRRMLSTPYLGAGTLPVQRPGSSLVLYRQS